MLITVLLAFLASSQAPAPGAPPEIPVLNARLGGCSAEFLVKDAVGLPVYLALVHVNVRYGPLNVKRMDIEVGTNSDGKAQIKGLPDKAKPARREGERGGRWVLLDYVDIVVHVQHTEEREFYSLDRLWKDCPTIEFVDQDLPAASGAA